MNKITICDLVSCTKSYLPSLYKVVGIKFLDDEQMNEMGGMYVIKDIRTDEEELVLGKYLIVWKPVDKG